jgi:flagellar hook-length control protein FliK
MSDDPSKPAHIITKTIPEGEILKLSPTFRIEELINRLQSTVASESGTVQFDVTSDKASVLDQRLNRSDVLKVGPDIIKMDPSGIKNDAEVITNKFLFNAELTKFSNFKHALRFETATSIPALNNSVKNLSTSGPLSMSEFLANNSGKLEFGKFLSLRAKSATSLNRSEFHQNKQSALPDLIIDKVDKNLIETKPLPSVSTAVEQPIAISVKGSGSESIVPNGAAKISLYNAQYASRIGMLIVDKLLQGQENFEFQLEPESFGKIKVNVLLDKQSLDIRMVAETQAAASILKTNEEALSQITGQNGMKLASFSVGTQSGSDQSGQSPGQNKNKANENSNRVSKHVEMQTSQGDAYYRNSTGLNLIA